MKFGDFFWEVFYSYCLTRSNPWESPRQSRGFTYLIIKILCCCVFWQKPSGSWTNCIQKGPGQSPSPNRKMFWKGSLMRLLAKSEEARQLRLIWIVYEVIYNTAILEVLQWASRGSQKTGQGCLRVIFQQSLLPESALQAHSFDAADFFGPNKHRPSRCRDP